MYSHRNRTGNRDNVMSAIGDAMYVAATVRAAQLHAAGQDVKPGG
jgi:hypothetical protein